MILFFLPTFYQLSQEPNISITLLSTTNFRVTLISFFFLYKELIPFQHICKWPSDVFYNLVNYCFSRQDSRDPEHTWPEGTYLNNCFSCRTQRTRGGKGGREVEANGLVTLCSTSWNVNWSQGSPFLSLLLLSSMLVYGDGWLWH